MVAVVDSGDISEHLAYRLIQGRPASYSIAWRDKWWQGAKSHLALLLADETSIRWLGRARGRKRVSDRERRIEVTEIEEVSGPPLDVLRNQLPAGQQSGLRLGILSEAVGREVLKALLSMYPELANLIARLNR